MTRQIRRQRLNNRSTGRVFTLVAGLAAVLIATAVTARAAERSPSVDFDRDIQRLLSDNCYHCHGPDATQRKADLRLDILDDDLGPFATRENATIVPGKPEESELIRRLSTGDPAERMPPPDSNRHLKPEQIETIRQWVAEGAEWDKHWAFVAPTRPELPAVKQKDWVANPIDTFILARLENEGLSPSESASKKALIRRVSLDLNGLPPTPQEVAAFVADRSPDAYEKLVDRLLASPRYGERMVWEWLEASRYADTNGYQADPTRTMWPWRDWVIGAMNDNMSFDQFVTWQLAGDLLPNRTRDQRLASAFNRNHPYNGEGGRIPEETRVENVFDRVDTTSTIFLGLTVACARCHDHKFDQISQEEYYQLFAYFNQSSETGELKYARDGNAFPVMSWANAEEQKHLDNLQQAAKAAAEQVNADSTEIDARQAAWEASVSPASIWTPVVPTAATSTGGATMTIQPDGIITVSGKNPLTDVHHVTLKPSLASISALQIEVLPDPSLPKGGPGRSLNSGNFALTNLEAAIAADTATQPALAAFESADATFSQGGFDVAGAIDSDPKSAWSVFRGEQRDPISAIFRFAEPVNLDLGGELRLTLRYESKHKSHSVGRFRIAVTDGPALTPAVATVLAIPPEARDDAQRKAVREYYRTRIDEQSRKLNAAAVAAKQAAEDYERNLSKIMIMDDAKPRQAHILQKGAYNAPGEKVEPGVLAVLNPLPETEKNDRLTLAKWIVDPSNPLTARVTVNRYWQQFFGTGIVKTVDDFGVQGERPVHPELLDWLAVEFTESGWDVKAMHRMIVMSSTYRQSSRVTPEQLERDPENRLLSRGARFRMPSVMLRDQALAVSGLLVEKVGGAPVNPYQPPGIWEEATFGFIKYVQDHGDALYRRGVYTFWRRIVGPTQLFDAAARTVCTVRPSRTNTPLHALTTLNDTTYVEAARALAQRVMLETQDDEERIELAVRHVLCRTPSQQEFIVLQAGLERLRSQYGQDPQAAGKLLGVGESKRDETLAPADHAAYTGLCLTILNLDEALTKE